MSVSQSAILTFLLYFFLIFFTFPGETIYSETEEGKSAVSRSNLIKDGEKASPVWSTHLQRPSSSVYVDGEEHRGEDAEGDDVDLGGGTAKP